MAEKRGYRDIYALYNFSLQAPRFYYYRYYYFHLE